MVERGTYKSKTKMGRTVGWPVFCYRAQARPSTFFIIAIGIMMQVPDAYNLAQ